MWYYFYLLKETIRGSTFNDSITIIDESQQLDWASAKSIVSRIGNNSKLIMTGDPAQRDQKEKGLETLIETIIKHNIPDVGIVNFTPEDCVRSEIVKNLLYAFEKDQI